MGKHAEPSNHAKLDNIPGKILFCGVQEVTPQRKNKFVKRKEECGLQRSCKKTTVITEYSYDLCK